jgi:hypothetical protein
MQVPLSRILVFGALVLSAPMGATLYYLANPAVADDTWSAERCHHEAERATREYWALKQRLTPCTDEGGCTAFSLTLPGGVVGGCDVVPRDEFKRFTTELSALNARYSSYSEHGCPPGGIASAAVPIPICQGGACLGLNLCGRTCAAHACVPQSTFRVAKVPFEDGRRHEFRIVTYGEVPCACDCGSAGE